MPDIPGDTSTTTSITVGGIVNDTIEVIGDHDWIRITLTAGQSITITLNGVTLSDPYLRVLNSAGTQLAFDDDGGAGFNSLLNFTATTAGTYYIDASAFGNATGSYQLSVTDGPPPLPVFTNDQIATQLTTGFWTWRSEAPREFAVAPGGSLTVNLTALTAEGQFFARAALAMWTDALGITFTEVASGGQITFDDNDSGAYSTSVHSGGIISSSHVNVHTSWYAGDEGDLDSYSFQTYIHEIGHALGLGHGGNYNGSASYAVDAHYQNDSWATTIMSYFDQTENTYFAGQGFTRNFIGTPQVADLIAVHAMYGTPTTTRTGNTTYGFGSTAGRDVFNAALYPNIAYTIIDNGGIDTLNYSLFSTNQRINLNAESFSNVGSGVGNVNIARGTVIENATGGSGNDTIIGNAANNVLVGGLGADAMHGNNGNDIFYVDNAGDQAFETSAGGGIDAVSSSVTFTLGSFVENLYLTGTAAITGTGNTLNNILSGNSGNNILNGGNGNDTLNGGAGADIMYGGAGDDTYYADNAGDRANEGAALGTDRVLSSVTFTLGVNVENLTLTGASAINGFGNALNNILIGNSGNNILNGSTGADNMNGGAGNDTYYVDNALDRAIEGSAAWGVDHVISSVSFVLGNYVDNLTLTGTAAINGFGSSQNNVIVGNAGNNILNGGAGNDSLNGGAGIDHLYGGLGNDSLTGGTGADRFIFNTALNAATNVDVLTDFSVVDDTIALDQTLFTALPASGSLALAAFRAGTAAGDADDRIIYDAATGRIYYDADGNGAAAQVLFATVAIGTALTNADFLMLP